MAPRELLLFGFLLVTGVMIARLRDLFAAAMLTGMFSLLSASLFVLNDAVDVAFTEAAVGAGVSTILLLGTLSLTAHREKPDPTRVLPFAVVILTGAALFLGGFGWARGHCPSVAVMKAKGQFHACLLYTSPSPRD